MLRGAMPKPAFSKLRRYRACLALLVPLVLGRPARAADAKDLPTDATLAQLIRETLAVLPELRTGEQVVQAQAARTSQVGAWPDPVLQLGIQNDGFKSIEIGNMGTSFVSLMASQTMPWPGKTGLRESISELGTSEARQSLERAKLSAEAFVRSGYLDLLWARERRALIEQREKLWQHAIDAALAKYEAGTGPQVDVLRARLELARLQQQRALNDGQEQSTLQSLNRMRHHPLDEPIATTHSVRDLAAPAGLVETFSAERAVAHSPELAAAKSQAERAGKQIELSEKSYYPDLTLGAGFMYRGSLPPMWLVTVAAPVPVFARSKQGAAVVESRALDRAARNQIHMLEQLVRLRSSERRTQFVTLVETMRIYEQGLLGQSSATADAMLAQYQVGKANFASVLEANAGLISDQEGYLRTLVEAERLLIAERAVSLQAVALPSMSGGSSSSMSSGVSAPAAAAAAPGGAAVGGANAAVAPAGGGSMSGM
jgi:cobalt-zinc-cadmium efflux system outer membrane protein